jgi:hypothetical protein
VKTIFLARRTDELEACGGFAKGLSGLRVLDLAHGPHGGDVTIAEVFTDEAVAA